MSVVQLKEEVINAWQIWANLISGMNGSFNTDIIHLFDKYIFRDGTLFNVNSFSWNA